MQRDSTAVNGLIISEPPGGWPAFINATWEQQPSYFPDCCPSPLINEAELFDILCAACKKDNEFSFRQMVRFYLEHSRLLSLSSSDYLPRLADGSLNGYQARMSDTLNHRDFSLVVNNVQAHDFKLWSRMRMFVAGLYREIGIPLRSETMIYASVARRTATGLHSDPYSNFLFQLRGRKRFLMWPSEIVRAQPEIQRTLKYSRIVKDAFTADMKPGDILYMPSDCYHVAEASDELSVHLSVIISTAAELSHLISNRMISQIVGRRMKTTHVAPFIKPPADKSPGLSLPTTWSSAIEACDNLGPELRSSMIAELLRLSTSLGCEVSPPLAPAPPKLSDTDLIEIDPNSIFIHYVCDETLYFSSNGHGFSCPAHPGVLSLIERLKTGQVLKVGAIACDYSSEWHLKGDDVRNLLDSLHRIRSIRIMPT